MEYKFYVLKKHTRKGKDVFRLDAIMDTQNDVDMHINTTIGDYTLIYGVELELYKRLIDKEMKEAKYPPRET